MMKIIDEIWSGKSLGLYRKEIMGVAMIWVMIFHCYTKSLSKLNLRILYTICKHGNLGVDIFLILSGFGLYYSLSKDNHIFSFYKRRVVRIIIPWLVISCPYWIIKTFIADKESLGVFLLHWTGLSFWLDGITTVWYIAFIIFLYALYPLIFKLQKKNGYILAILVGGSIAFNVILLMLCPQYYDKIEIAISRIPVFLLGSYIGDSVYNSKQLIRNKLVFLYLLMLVFLYFYPVISDRLGAGTISTAELILIKRLRGQIVAIFIIVLSCACFSVVPKTKLKVFSFVGALTLEEYMFHVFLLNIFGRTGITGKANLSLRIVLLTFVIIGTVLISFLFSKVYSKAVDFFCERQVEKK